MKKLFLVLAIAATVAACNNGKEESTETSATTETPTEVAPTSSEATPSVTVSTPVATETVPATTASK